MRRLPWLLPLLGLALAPLLGAQDIQRLLAAAQVEWDSPSSGIEGAMPLPGMAGAGALVWFAQGELRLQLAHNGAYDGDEVLRKVGALRVRVEGMDARHPSKFSQALRLSDGTLVIKATVADGAELEHRLWFGGETLVIETRCSRAAGLAVGFGSWRADPAARGEDQVDLIEGALLHTHRNSQARRARQLAAEQGQDAAKADSPAAERVYGCALVARDGLAWSRPIGASFPDWQGHEWVGSSAPRREHVIALTLGAARRLDPETLLSRSRTVADPEVTPSIRRTADLRWEEFWGRSHVVIQPKAGPSDPRFQVGRNYLLRRFMDACNQRGELPLRADGGIFALPAPGSRDPDARPGPRGFAGQSLRWTGWPAGPDGDTDLREPVLRFYRDRLPQAQARAKALRAEGAVYPELLSLGGLTDGGASADGLARLPQLTHHFSSGLEHAWMAVRARQLDGRDIRPDLPWILGQIRFLETFPAAAGKPASPGTDRPLVLAPAGALQAASGATNPAQLVAALRALVPALLGLPEVADKDKAALRSLESRLPALPRAQRGGVEVLAMAERAPRLHAVEECPELHAIWPYGLVGRARPETLELGLATWRQLGLGWDGRTDRPERRQSLHGGGSLPHAASLGLAEEAARRALQLLADAASGHRFKGFAGSGRGGVPDLVLAGNARAGLQAMLLDGEPGPDGRITLLPCWPATWDVTFRLRAPGNTRVTCVVESGKIERLIVDPPARLADVVAGPGWKLPEERR
jgi:hypothetical protein